MLKRILALIYRRQLITVKHLIGDLPAAPDRADVDCVMLDSAAGLRRFAHEMPCWFRDSLQVLEARLEEGCTVCLARRKRENGLGMEVIGYELAERGIFSALGRRVRVSPEIVFSHWVEVIPERRGQRVHGAIFATRDEYFRTRGGAMVVGVVRPDNDASLRALRRIGWDIAGSVRQVALGLWRTRESDIVRMLAEAGRRRLEFLESQNGNPEAPALSRAASERAAPAAAGGDIPGRHGLSCP